VYWLLTENYVLNANILVFMLIHTDLFSNVSGLGLEKNFGPRPRPRPHSFWPRPRPWPHAQLASLTSLLLNAPRCVLGYRSDAPVVEQNVRYPDEIGRKPDALQVAVF